MRVAAAEALWRVGRDGKVVLPVLPAAQDRAGWQRAEAIRLLGEMGPAARAVAPHLAELARAEPWLHDVVAEALGRMGAAKDQNRA